MRNIRHSVGRNAVKNRQDVIIVQSLLKRHGHHMSMLMEYVVRLQKRQSLSFRVNFIHILMVL